MRAMPIGWRGLWLVTTGAKAGQGGRCPGRGATGRCYVHVRAAPGAHCMSEVWVTLRDTAHRPYPGVPVADNVSSPPSQSAEASSCLVCNRTASHCGPPRFSPTTQA
ncbi:hypothetical protein PF005_g6119 [Phytophthora fragariae]|uniref:Secreted protein n=1 Tax=Phytophthora fragariae TaxID=53985 RepID=A0A6A3FGZ3_9STRA|nr:hypothetical protein PF003_g10482 [Phytophthora fragariae]KAE8944413.1 hypothetical protein PF009_g5906 [Phytophthora fragariae]KAE9020798.1 hypothetical protein PF011_g5236 [Phytophthora fragariae]KAE9124087.1 hypothetical protein PF007_g6841 [Phytophthora fragariae]KAE9127483.1 hypothetical protein PF010_g4875 [Phytophthora fragariae]